MNERITDR